MKNQRRAHSTLLTVALVVFLFTFTPFLYAYSNLIGWTQAKGFEVLYFLLALVTVAFHFYLVKSGKALFKTLAIWLGFIGGALLPWVLNEPWWIRAEPIKGGYSNVDEFRVERIAHAGGHLDGETYTNSMEALERNSRDFKFFEFDLSRTMDGDFVCVHDWPFFWQQLGVEGKRKAPTTEEFFSLAKNGDWTPCTIPSLREWTVRNPNKYIILDLKVSDPPFAYAEIASELGEQSMSFIPQMYFPENYLEISGDDWAGIIWTQYRRPYSLQQSINIWGTLDLLAIALPKERSSVFFDSPVEHQIPFLAHTVNDFRTFSELKALGIDEIYTDFLRPSDVN